MAGLNFIKSRIQAGTIVFLFAALAPSLLLSASCVLPIGPDFEDPDPNFAPYVVNASPPAGAIITPVNNRAEFSVTIGDPNTNDPLYVRWIYDYPTYEESTRLVIGPTIPPPRNSSIERSTIRLVTDCDLHNIARGASEHRIMLVVADRPFVETALAPPDFRLSTVSEDAQLVTVSWFLNMECK